VLLSRGLGPGGVKEARRRSKSAARAAGGRETGGGTAPLEFQGSRRSKMKLRTDLEFVDSSRS